MLKAIEKIIKLSLLWLVAVIWPKRELPSLPLDISKIRNLLIYRPEKIGDLLMALPLISVLKRENPSLLIDAIISPVALPLIDSDPRFNKIFLYSKKLWADLMTAAGTRKTKYDIIIDLVGSDSATAAMTVLYISKKSAFTVSVGKQSLARYYGRNFAIYPYRHMTESTLQPLSLFGITAGPSDCYSPPAIDNRMYHNAEKFFANLNLKNSDRLIGLNISAGNKNRRWPDENNIELIKQIGRTFPELKPVIFAAPDDFGRARILAEKSEIDTVVIPEGLNIREVSAIITKMSIFVSPDTSLIHIARALHIPVVGMYIPYNENYRRWGPLSQKYGILVAPGDDAIDKILPSTVINEIRKVLADQV